MSNEVPWTKIILETFISEANLTKEDEWIMRTRCAGWSRVKQSQYLHISLSCLDKKIKKLKEKYDQVQKTNCLLPPRKYSVQEKWMDTH